VEIPVTVNSLDRVRPFSEKCVALIVSCQGCGFRSSRALQIETPIILSDLPGGSSVTGHVASCLPLGNDGKYFVIGASLYTHGNVWGIADPPEDWDPAPSSVGAGASNTRPAADQLSGSPKNWPYRMFADGVPVHSGKK
jgi:hypothetical protein